MACEGCGERADATEARNPIVGAWRSVRGEALSRLYSRRFTDDDLDGAPRGWMPSADDAPAPETTDAQKAAVDALPEPEEYHDSVRDRRSADG